MAFTELSSNGLTNDTTQVDVVAAPAVSTKRVIKSITVHNADTVDATVILQYYDGTNTRTLCKVTLATLENLYFDQALVLPDTSSIIKIVLGGAVTTNQLHWTAHFGDAT